MLSNHPSEQFFGLLLILLVIPKNGAYGLSDRQLNNLVQCPFHDSKYHCDCRFADGFLQLPHLGGSAFEVLVSNCKKLSVESKTISDILGLRRISFSNVENLTLLEHSLEYPRLAGSSGIIVEFSQTGIEEIQSHTLNGEIDEITFEKCSIGRIHPMAFHSFRQRAYSMKFLDTIVNHVDSQAFKKFTIDRISFENVEFMSVLPTRSFYELDVGEYFSIENTTFKGLHTKSFSLKSVSKFTINNSRFHKMQGECFEMNIIRGVTITNNFFGMMQPAAFKAIKIDKAASERYIIDFKFTNNTIETETFDPIEPNFHTFPNLVVKQLFYAQNFTCKQSEKLANIPFFQTHAEHTYFRINNAGNYRSVADIFNEYCMDKSYTAYIALGVSAVVLLILIVGGIVTYYWFKGQQKKKLDIVMPEPKTYRETQIILQIENAGLLKTDL